MHDALWRNTESRLVIHPSRIVSYVMRRSERIWKHRGGHIMIISQRQIALQRAIIAPLIGAQQSTGGFTRDHSNATQLNVWSLRLHDHERSHKKQAGGRAGKPALATGGAQLGGVGVLTDSAACHATAVFFFWPLIARGNLR